VTGPAQIVVCAHPLQAKKNIATAARGVFIANRNPYTEMNNMRLPKNLGMLLLAIWLIATGLIELFSVSFANQTEIMAILAVAAGVLLLLSGR
jgi:hypothetical protein